MEKEKVIKTEGLGKVFDNQVKALSNLSLEVEKGEIFGFLGPNGSGKTTTVRLLNGTLTPSSGFYSVLGQTGNSQVVRQKTSTLSESALMYENLSVYDNLAFFSEMYGLTAKEADARIKELLEKINLPEKSNVKLGSLSTGMKKRVYLIRCLLNRPEIIFLDEPTSGLDPEAALKVNKLIHELAKKEGLTVFLCTHNLSLAEMICDTFGFIRSGEMIAYGKKEQIISSVISRNQVKISTVAAEYIYDFTDKTEINGLIKKLQDQGEMVCEVKIIRPTLEDAYFHYIGKVHDEQ